MEAKRPVAVIADDEPRLAEYLRSRLALAWPELAIAGIAANGIEAQALIRAEDPDVAFLDIRMPGLSGLEVARAAPRELAVVFVTAYDDHAVEAFERAALDYLLKPVTDERLAETVARLKARLDQPAPDASVTDALATLARLLPAGIGSAVPGRLAWIRAAVGAQVRLIAVDDVCYFEANDKYTSVYTSEGEALIRTPLKELADQLDPQRFWQIHRSTIVNVAQVATTLRDVGGRTRLKLKSRSETLAVSRAYAHLFRQM